ncbi:MAG: ABC transporter ATP-binding protein [Micrococcaceae bacterium]
MLLRLVFQQFSRYKFYVLLVCLLQLFQALASLYLPTLNADIIDNGVIKNNQAYIWHTGGWMLFVSLVQVLATVAALLFSVRISMGAGQNLRSKLFTKVQSFSSLEVGTFGAPSLITRTTNDVQQVQMFVQTLLTMLISAPIAAIGGIIMAMRQDSSLVWVLYVIIPVLVVVIGTIMKFMVPLFKKAQTQIDGVNKVLREQIMGMDVIRAFVRKNFEESRFDRANLALTKTQTRAGQIMALMFPLITVIVNVAILLVIYFGGHHIDNGTMQIGALTAYISYIMQIMMSVMMAMFVFVMAPRASICADRISEVLNTDTTISNPATGLKLPDEDAEVEFDHVSFAYPGAEGKVLQDVNFDVKPGQTMAIIGATGSGKSTLLGLITRFYDATAGEVKIAGHNIKDYDLHSLRTHIGIVPQKAFLFKGTIASNLRYGNPQASDEQLWEALRIAQAADFVSEETGQLEAEVAQGGDNFSGGQRQRLAIARALVAQPPIYLFDDSFSALDVATDSRLRAALVPVTQDAVTIIVAQRVSTIMNADKILVLDEGHVEGLGTHQELLEHCETYQEIVYSQMSADEAGSMEGAHA